MALSAWCHQGMAVRCRLSRTQVAPALRPCGRSSRKGLRVQALFGGGQGGGNPFDMKNLMESVKKAQSMVQQETQRVQQELGTTEFEGYDEEETVRVIMSGNQEPKAVDITKEAIDAGPEELSARVLTAMKDAHGKSVAGMKEKMKGLAASLGIPSPGSMPGMPGLGN